VLEPLSTSFTIRTISWLYISAMLTGM